jgi:hypothetical protein
LPNAIWAWLPELFLVLKTYFALKLSELGYPHQDISYALNYRLGDGVAFYGRVDSSMLCRLANRLLCEQGRREFSNHRAVIRKAVKLGMSIQIEHKGSPGGAYSDSMVARAILPTSAPLSPYQHNVLGEFLALVKADIKATSALLTTLGYALASSSPDQAAVTRVYRCGKTMVLVKEVPDPNYDPFAALGQKDGRQIADLFAHGVLRHYGLQVEIRSKKDGEPLSMAMQSGVIEDLRDGGLRSAYRSTLRAIFKEARSRLRFSIGSLRDAA